MFRSVILLSNIPKLLCINVLHLTRLFDKSPIWWQICCQVKKMMSSLSFIIIKKPETFASGHQIKQLNIKTEGHP